MARSGNFWKWYATVNDDIRQNVVQRGQASHSNDFQRNVEGMENRPQNAPLQATVKTHDPYRPEPLRSIGMNGDDNVNGESTKQAVNNYYGLNQPQDQSGGSVWGNSRGSIYGDVEQEEQSTDIYGNNPQSGGNVWGNEEQEQSGGNVWGNGQSQNNQSFDNVYGRGTSQDQEPEQEP